MGSPRTFKYLWSDQSYHKSKEILEIGDYHNDYDKLRDKEPILIEESWTKYGIYSDGGRSLNVRAGKIVHKKFLIGENNPSKRDDVKQKLSYIKKEEYKNKPIPFHTEEAKRKAQEGISKFYSEKGLSRNHHLLQWHKENPDKNPTKNNPEMAKYLSEINKERLKDPKERKRMSDNAKRMWSRWKEHPEENPHITPEAIEKRKEVAARPEVKKRQSDARKLWWKNVGMSDDTKKKISDANKRRFADGEPNPFSNPEIHAKSWATRRKNMEEKKRLRQINSLENYFE